MCPTLTPQAFPIDPMAAYAWTADYFCDGKCCSVEADPLRQDAAIQPASFYQQDSADPTSPLVPSPVSYTYDETSSSFSPSSEWSDSTFDDLVETTNFCFDWVPTKTEICSAMPSPHQPLPQSPLYEDQYPLPQHHQFFFGEQSYPIANFAEDPISEQIRRNEELAMQLSPVAKYLEQQRSLSQRKPQQPVRRKFSLAHGCLNTKKAPAHLFKPHKNNTSARRWYQEVAIKVLGRTKPRLPYAPPRNVQLSPHFDVSQYLA